MNLNAIAVLIQIRVFPDYEPKEKWEENAVNDLRKHGYIKENKLLKHDITEKGACIVDHISEIPDPVQSWKIPK